MRVGVIGTGAMGQHHVRNYAEMANAELVGIADCNKERVERLAEKYNTTPYTDYKDLLNENLDAVSIAVPTKLHREIATATMNKEINVLVEKPIADTIQNANAMIELSDKKNVKLMVGHIERFNPAVMALKKYIDEGKFGRVVSISSTRVGPFDSRPRDVGVIIDLGVHDIDLMSYFYSDRIKKVYANAGSVINEFEDYASIFLSFNNGYAGTIRTNWLTPHKVRKLTITGTEGIAYADYIKPSLELFSRGEEINVKLEEKEPLRLELESFIECIERDREPMVTGEDGLNALRVAQAAIESYKTGKIIEVSR